MKYVWALVIVGLLLANIGAVWLVKKLYSDVNALRLDPLQLSVYEEVAPKQQPNSQRVVFFGDSRVLSWSVPDVRGFEFVNRGIGNQTSEQIRLRWQQHVAPLQPDIVVLQLCVNDLKTIPLFPERRDAIVQRCQNNLQAIVEMTRQAGSDVLLTTVFPLGEVPLERKLFWSDEVATAINEVNTFMYTLEEQGVLVADAYELLREEVSEKVRPAYSRDLLHLNAKGYEVLNQNLPKWLVLLGQK